MSYNKISTFPTDTIYNIRSLKNLYFHHNQLSDVPGYAFFNISNVEIIDFSYNNLTTFELWAADVKTRADFSNNRISTITNQYFFNTFLTSPYNLKPYVSLRNNPSITNFNDGLYEMYNACREARVWYFETGAGETQPPFFTFKLANIDFGLVTLPCSCDQLYLRYAILEGFILNFNPSLSNTSCTSESGGGRFVDYLCPLTVPDSFSPVNFSQIFPRQCKIDDSEAGTINNASNFTRPINTRVRYLIHRLTFCLIFYRLANVSVLQNRLAGSWTLFLCLFESINGSYSMYN